MTKAKCIDPYILNNCLSRHYIRAWHGMYISWTYAHMCWALNLFHSGISQGFEILWYINRVIYHAMETLSNIETLYMESPSVRQVKYSVGIFLLGAGTSFCTNRQVADDLIWNDSYNVIVMCLFHYTYGQHCSNVFHELSSSWCTTCWCYR